MLTLNCWLLISLLQLRENRAYNNFTSYIVCHPCGGLNDMLFSLQRCLLHSIQYNRLLIIDTTKVAWFRHDIHDYIKFDHPNIYTGNLTAIYSKIEHLTIYPNEIKGFLSTFKAEYDIQRHSYVFNITNTGEIISTNINLENNYSEEVIVFANFGGGLPSLLLEHIQFKKIITNVYYERMSKLPLNFVGIHIRNTDHQSDVQGFIKQHDHILKTQFFFLASDDINTINLFKELYKENMFHFANIPPVAYVGKGIHYKQTFSIDRQQDFIIDCINDVLLLSSSTKIYSSASYSGYSNLALYIFEKKKLLYKLINNNTNVEYTV
jgi:hypothetical protein